jgi:hypothetical protein
MFRTFSNTLHAFCHAGSFTMQREVALLPPYDGLPTKTSIEPVALLTE